MPIEETARLQRALTVEFITRRRLNLPAVWFRPNTGAVDAADALADKLEVDLGAWDGPEHNLGVRLQDGHLELSLKAGDDAFAHAFFLAAEHLRIDARCAFGVDRISSVILRVEDQELIEPWAPRWPKGFKDKHGHWTETKVTTSSLKTKNAAAVYRYSKPLPGSVTPDGAVVWRPKGKAAALDVDFGIEDLEPRSLAPTGMDALIRALAYATLAYWVRTYLDGLTDWDASLTRFLGGWLARVEVEGRGINAKGKSLEGICWCPVDTREMALDLVAFLGKVGASNDLKVAYLHGESQLIRDPLAPVAGWTALTNLFGSDGKLGIRRAFRAGLDLDVVERMAERYIYDESTGEYYDRDALLKGAAYERKHEVLVRTHGNDAVFVGKKRMNPFQLYTASQLRTDVLRSDMFPGAEPAAILRCSPIHGLLKADETQPDEFKVLNTYRGFTIKPIGVVDPEIMRKVISALDYLLGLLTKDNDDQMRWIKKFIAWTLQHPELKQQVAPVIIGGQGIGKSFLGQFLIPALFGDLAGEANSSALDDNNFLITPFINKLMVFIDEVRLESVGSINEIKRLVRSVNISGEVKFGHRHDYRIYARLIMAANQADIGLTAEDAADRALFFIRSWDAEGKNMSDQEFQQWAVGLKPFFDDFARMLESVAVRQHLMRYFCDTECSRAELEDLTLSSRHDPNIVRSTMSKAREVARNIAASARVHAALDITAWFNQQHLREAIRREDGPKTRVEVASVRAEYERAGVLEQMSGGYYRFKWNYGRLLQRLGEAHGLPLEPIYPTGPGDFEDNDVRSTANAPLWRGNPKAKQNDNRRRPFDVSDRDDPDYLEPE
jgi:hypothetical protein